MSRRKGEITRSNLRRRSPHHVALAAKVRGLKNSEVVRGFADAAAIAQGEVIGGHLPATRIVIPD